MVRPAVAALWLACAGGACTKVQEQPELPRQVMAQPIASAPAKPARPRNTPWPSSTPFAPDRVAPARRSAPDTRPAVETLNGDPNGLKREDLQKVMDGAMPALAGCFEGSEGSISVAVSFDADPGGKATNLKVSGGGAGAEKCVSGVAAGLRLPSFAGASVPVHFPLSIRAPIRAKPAAAASPGAPAAAPEPAAPAPLFMNP